ncbi:MAG: serine hydrolase domain-containing protein [Ilumatobacteraceae bacterium]
MGGAFDDLNQLIRGLVEGGELVDAQYAFGREGEVVAAEAFGSATPDSRFCIFSSTKPVFASLVWRLLDDDRLRLDTRVVELWPEFGQHGKDTITIEQLLLFTAGIPNGSITRDEVGSRESRARAMERWEIEWEPGSRYQYHPFSAGWVLSEIVSRLTGLDHGAALRALVLDPLGIERLDLGSAVNLIGDIRPVQLIRSAPVDPFEVLTGQPSPAPAADRGGPEAFDILGFANDPVVIAAGAPGAGAIADASSVARFYQALLHNPAGLWSAGILRDATTNIRNTMPDPLRLGAPANRTIGLIIATDDNPRLSRPAYGVDLVMHPFAPSVSPSTFGHGGGGGQIAFADPTTGVSFCFLSNAIDQDTFGAFANQHAIIAAALTAVR